VDAAFSYMRRVAPFGRRGLLSASFAAKAPLGRPKDTKRAGSDEDASERIPDMLSADVGYTTYLGNGYLIRGGARARTTGSGKGAEYVAYVAPLTGWFNGSRGFYGLEIEAGHRKGDAEFKNLTTKAPDRGDIVARLGLVAEWAPRVAGINKDLGHGLRFFVRGRGWADYFRNDSGSYGWRLKPFVDSELFWNFQKDYRVFVRAEYGSLPPDLSQDVKRVYAGVGAAF
jgi:hypothetical protein